MKAHIEASPRGDLKGLARLVPGSNPGKVQKKGQKQQEHVESGEIKAYLSKLQQLVPYMPKDKKLSKLEVITHVIDYIRELRQTLGLPPSCAGGEDFDMDMLMTQTVDEERTTVTLTVINDSCGGDERLKSGAAGVHQQDQSVGYQSQCQVARQPLGVISTTTNSILRSEAADKVIYSRDSS